MMLHMGQVLIRAEYEPAGEASPDVLSSAAKLAQAPSIERALQAVKDFLGMDIAYASELIGEHMHIRRIEGDDTPSGVDPLYVMPFEQTYCKRILDGDLPNLMADVRGNEIAAALPITQAEDIGAFCSVPLRFSDGRLYGTLCAESHQIRNEFSTRDLEFMHVFARIISDQLERQVFAEQAHQLELENTAAAAILAAVASRDSYTGEHSRAVVELALLVARELGMGPSETQELRQVALLHDIGKLAIPDSILGKPGKLTAEEEAIMRRHPIESERIVLGLPGLQHLATAIRAEHERFDGRGYPDGLAGGSIPLASRITFVCDAYHAMVSDRPYRAAMSLAQARQQLGDGTGAQFCPTATRALLAVLPE
jgi:HD-GYP domain-containing protein (c-di-GMP phosphodiesterase class II)